MRRLTRPLITMAALMAAGCWIAPAQAGGRTAGCVPTTKPHGTAATIVDIAKTARRELDLSAAIVRVTVGGREVVTTAIGQSMTGVPATTDMRFRVGAVGIAYLNMVLLQLVDEGVVKLDDPIARWLPALPRAERITLRMLGSSTSGYPDYVTYPPFAAKFYADPFHQWTEQELIDLSLARPFWTTAKGAVLTSDICDLESSARAVGTGRLMSAGAMRTLLDPGIVGLGHPTPTCPETICVHQTPERHFGLGVIVQNGWIKQSPSFAGYSAVQTYLPGRDIAIAVVTTRGRTTTVVDSAETVASRIAALYTTPSDG